MMTKSISNFVSFLLHPLFMPLYGLVLVLNTFYFQILLFPTKFSIYLYSIIFVNTVFLPIIFIYSYQKYFRKNDIYLDVKENRFVPYIFTIICYLFTRYILLKVQFLSFLIFFIDSAIISLIVLLLSNIKQKNSAHTVGITGLFVCFIIFQYQYQFTFLWLNIILILLMGIIGSIRIYLQKHTLSQVSYGYLIGFVGPIISIILHSKF
jgi:hypothetical protein